MATYPPALEALIEAFTKFPGVGRKTASRFAFHLLRAPREEVEALGKAVLRLRERVKLCRRCFNLSEGELCAICSDPRRDAGLLCVVEEVHDLVAIEATGAYRGLYHVLHGSLSPLEGIGPGEIRVKELIERVKKERPREVIVATDPDVEGEATALYLLKVLKPLGVRLTRIAQGLPAGSEIEYADPKTLSRSLEGRREL